MNKLLKDAIADAKAVRETAMANAKLALEEAFAPKIQSMLTHKIKEELEDDEETIEYSNTMEGDEMMSDEDDSEEIAAEGGMYEDDDVDDVDDEEVAVEKQEEDEITDDELEEILRELDGDEEEMAMQTEEDDEADEEELMATEAKRKRKMKMMEMDNEDDYEMKAEGDDEEEVSIEEIIRALREEDHDDDSKESEAETEKELEEAYKVIKFLRTKLNEINLLNAKLLYVNKLFKKAELTEAKKMKVIETFDRVRSVREAKLVYATLSESLTAGVNKKSTIKSGRTSLKEGFASKPSRGTRVINESNQVVNRFKELVNYNKNNF